jgi:hypothetical protein
VVSICTSHIPYKRYTRARGGPRGPEIGRDPEPSGTCPAAETVPTIRPRPRGSAKGRVRFPCENTGRGGLVAKQLLWVGLPMRPPFSADGGRWSHHCGEAQQVEHPAVNREARFEACLTARGSSNGRTPGSDPGSRGSNPWSRFAGSGFGWAVRGLCALRHGSSSGSMSLVRAAVIAGASAWSMATPRIGHRHRGCRACAAPHRRCLVIRAWVGYVGVVRGI